MYSLIESAELNGLNPQHYLTDVLARIADHPAKRIAELLPWNWKPPGLMSCGWVACTTGATLMERQPMDSERELFLDLAESLPGFLELFLGVRGVLDRAA